MDLRIERARELVADTRRIDGFYRHGWHSWSPTGWVNRRDPVVPIRDVGRRLGHDDPNHAFDTQAGGSGVGVARCTDGMFVLLGALTPGARVEPDGELLRGTSEAGQIEWLVVEGTMNEVFDAYVQELTTRLGRRGRGRMRVWCSWYSYYTVCCAVQARRRSSTLHSATLLRRRRQRQASTKKRFSTSWRTMSIVLTGPENLSHQPRRSVLGERSKYCL